MMTAPIWYKYATFDDDGFVDGIRDDAPEDVKRAYEEYIEEQKKAEADHEFVFR